MAKHKRKTSRRRRRGMSEAGTRKRRRRSSSRGLLGAAGALSKTNLIESGKELVGGGIGGFVGGKLYHLTAGQKPFNKFLAFGGASVAAHLFGFKNMAAGLAGSYGFALAAGMPGMSEDDDEEMEEHEYTDREALSEMADAEDENGRPMFLMDDGNYYYAEELEEGEDDDDDEDGNMSATELLADSGMYPSYANISNY